MTEQERESIISALDQIRLMVTSVEGWMGDRELLGAAIAVSGVAWSVNEKTAAELAAVIEATKGGLAGTKVVNYAVRLVPLSEGQREDLDRRKREMIDSLTAGLGLEV